MGGVDHGGAALLGLGLGDAGVYWHSDLSYKELPSLGSMLHAQELPSEGGDTLFANMYLAYETLSDGMKAMLTGLRGVNSSAKAATTKTREDRLPSPS